MLAHNNATYIAGFVGHRENLGLSPLAHHYSPLLDSMRALYEAHAKWDTRYSELRKSLGPNEEAELRKLARKLGLKEKAERVANTALAVIKKRKEIAFDAKQRGVGNHTAAIELQEVSNAQVHARDLAHNFGILETHDLSALRIGGEHTRHAGGEELSALIRGMISSAPRVDREGRPITVRTRAYSGLPRIMFNEALVRQAVHNLVSDALNHGDNNHPIIVTVRGGGKTHPEAVVVSVSNRGPPLSREIIRKVGREPIVRGPGLHRGMGKIFARFVARMHHGDLLAGNTRLRDGSGRLARSPRLQLVLRDQRAD